MPEFKELVIAGEYSKDDVVKALTLSGYTVKVRSEDVEEKDFWIVSYK